MFSNVGEKIKKVTLVLCVLGMAASVIGGIILIFMGGFLEGLLTAVLGCVLTWISSLFTYAIGSIEDNLSVLTDIACKKALAEDKNA